MRWREEEEGAVDGLDVCFGCAASWASALARGGEELWRSSRDEPQRPRPGCSLYVVSMPAQLITRLAPVIAHRSKSDCRAPLNGNLESANLDASALKEGEQTGAVKCRRQCRQRLLLFGGRREQSRRRLMSRGRQGAGCEGQAGSWGHRTAVARRQERL